MVLYLSTWGGEPAFTFSVVGMLHQAGMVVELCSHPDLLAALLAAHTDPGIAPGHVIAISDTTSTATPLRHAPP